MSFSECGPILNTCVWALASSFVAFVAAGVAYLKAHNVERRGIILHRKK